MVAYNRQEKVAPTLVGNALTASYPMPGLPLRTEGGNAYKWGGSSGWASPVAYIEEGGNSNLTGSP